jgi:hypothetical protein
LLADGWTYFEQVVKHKARFFLSNVGRNEDNPSAPGPLHALNLLVKLVNEYRFFETLAPGTVLYRLRETADGEMPSLASDFGPPPPEKATQSNRMTPPGISALYTSLDRVTCQQEVPARDRYRRFVGSLVSQREIKLIDLTRIPPPPPLLCGSDPRRRHGLQFLEAFAIMIAQPVARDDRVHIDYVPTQVVSEFLMHAFNESGVTGMKFSSAKASGGANAVVFAGPECMAPGWQRSAGLFTLSAWEEVPCCTS